MGEPTIQILGVYQVEPTETLFRQAMELKYGGLKLSQSQRHQAESSVRGEISSIVLIEVLVVNRDNRFALGDFTQPGSDQAAYDEAFLSLDGTTVLSRFRPPEVEPLRLAFFLHYFDPNKPLTTSYGQLPVPPMQKMPERLQALLPYQPID